MISYGFFERGDETFLVVRVVDKFDKVLGGGHCWMLITVLGWRLSISTKRSRQEHTEMSRDCFATLIEQRKRRRRKEDAFLKWLSAGIPDFILLWPLRYLILSLLHVREFEWSNFEMSEI